MKNADECGPSRVGHRRALSRHATDPNSPWENSRRSSQKIVAIMVVVECLVDERLVIFCVSLHSAPSPVVSVATARCATTRGRAICRGTTKKTDSYGFIIVCSIIRQEGARGRWELRPSVRV